MAAPKKKAGSKKENLSVPPTAPQPEDDGIVELDQAIRLLHTSRTTLYRWIREGRIRAMKAGRQWRFRREDIDHFLAGENPRPALAVSPEPLVTALRAALEALGVKPPLPDADPLQEAVTLLKRFRH
jgi:excisionase family DNA binding protein